jgi:signal transduction histidine kinase
LSRSPLFLVSAAVTKTKTSIDGLTLAVLALMVAAVALFLVVGHDYQEWIQVVLVVVAALAVVTVARPQLGRVHLSAAGRRAQRSQRRVALRQVTLISAVFLVLAASVVSMPRIAAQRSADGVASRVLLAESDRLVTDVLAVMKLEDSLQATTAGIDLQRTYCLSTGGFVTLQALDGTTITWGDVPSLTETVRWQTGAVQKLREPRTRGKAGRTWLTMTLTTAGGDLVAGVPASESRAETTRARDYSVIALVLGTIIIATATWFLTTVALRPVVTTVERLEQFASDAGHELRVPLASIQVNAEVALQSDGLTGETRDRLEAVLRQTRRAAGLSNVLITLARLDEVRPAMTDRVRVADLGEELRTRFSSELVAKSLTITVAGGALVVVTNADALLLALDGLVTNAVHYSPAGSVVRLEAVQMHDGRTKVTVSDHGPGLTPEETERVFERFWRSDASRDRDTGGAGLGLAIVARAAEAISAHVAVESVLGEGSEFSLILPRSATP